MRIYTLSLLFIANTCLSNAFGKPSNDSLISRFRPGTMWFFTGIRPEKKGENRKYDRLIFDVTNSHFTSKKTRVEPQFPSLGLNTNLLFDIPISTNGHYSLGIGITHTFYVIRHENQLLSLQEKTMYKVKDSLSTFQHSLFAGNQIALPIEFRFKTKGWKHFKFHLGGKIGYQLNAYNKYIIKNDQDYRKIKAYHFEDLDRINYGIYARIGIRNWALYANYTLNPVFKNKLSTQLNVLQLGISLSLY